ncbi:MAG: Glu-tRNA(Gln) amidotransferase subunit GatD [Candidatus ainarchaeum sp.]|jgi:glutamyl-tRNA(Gln) amidotransferase subunit D|nr:Glu-tRNA(Gln) amidotransferase subunit GatD [Candidatus ainarchaeum sp.]MDD3085937.1 Glu-tRNA(Gln) amidotransferase subunit GatD [Candidatus ainarchaeum sp.]MDD4128526.1 Glu-tRNA(Gln) amidotransferase subunit GatD [Candidatus ainarchaeum sp.]MDD4467655.1 Glu-tRNA(Gln) amidotransferase subunit GatD [Candidatus ainarchaeum sp.]
MKLNEFYKKNNLKEGQLIEFNFEENKVKGTIIPSNLQEEIIMIKLESGYNAGFLTTKINNIKSLGEVKSVGKAKIMEIKKNPNLPTISILHTGGTIASRVNYSVGGVMASFDLEDLITMFPELATIANIESVFVTNMMSEDIQTQHIKKISQVVSEQIKKGIRGIIIGHGTDMLGYSAAALAFELENCPIPIIIVGSQRSSDRGSSDAAMNLICASTFITKTNFKGVAVCMHNSTNDDYCAIVDATKVRKMHTSRRDAFKPINDTPIALIDYRTKEIKWIKEKIDFEKQKGEFKLRNNFEEKVGLIKMHPFITEKEINYYKKEKYKGLIIEGTGLGHTPIRENDSFIKALKELIESECIIGITSQCLHGRVNSTVYTNLRKVASIGAIYCEDMLPETALMKLSWLLGNYSKEETIKMLSKNLRGEITTFTRTDTYNEE